MAFAHRQPAQCRPCMLDKGAIDEQGTGGGHRAKLPNANLIFKRGIRQYGRNGKPFRYVAEALSLPHGRRGNAIRPAL
jgi:hypothetical protein